MMVWVVVGKGVEVAVGTVGDGVKVGGMGVIVGVEVGGTGVGVRVIVGSNVGMAIFPPTIAPALLRPITSTIARITVSSNGPGVNIRFTLLIVITFVVEVLEMSVNFANRISRRHPERIEIIG